MNTFLSQNADTPLINMLDTMEFVKKVEKVADAVQIVWSDSLAERKSLIQSRSRDYIDQFSVSIFEKIDSATAHYLRFVDTHMNDKSEINIEECANRVSVGLWASFNDVRLIRKSVQFEKMGVQLDVPKQVLNQESRFVHRVIRMPINKLSLAPYESSKNVSSCIKNSSKLILGDIIQIDILIPPVLAFTMRAKKWTMRDNSAAACAVTKSPYPSSVFTRFIFKVSEEVVMSDDVRVAIWDEETKIWTEEGLTDYQYAESTRMAQVQVTAVGTIALVRDRVSEMPYKNWSLRVVRNAIDEINGETIHADGMMNNADREGGIFFERQARFTLTTTNHVVVIDIIGTFCMLISPDILEFSDLLQVQMSPGALLTKLQKKGLNIMPTENDLTVVPNLIPKVWKT